MSDIVCVIVQGTNWLAFITEEVNLVESFVFESTKSIRLVPTTRENIKWELATDGESQSIIGEFFPEDLNEFCSITILLSSVISAARKRVYKSYLINSFEFDPFLGTSILRQSSVVKDHYRYMTWPCVTANWTNIDHALTKLDKGSTSEVFNKDIVRVGNDTYRLMGMSKSAM